MKKYSLLFLNGKGANAVFANCMAKNSVEASSIFNLPSNGYLKIKGGKAWCVAENI